MANDRIAIRCCYCGEGYIFAKYYPGNLYPIKLQSDTLEVWLTQHIAERLQHGWKVYDADLQCEPGFEFVTEDAEFDSFGLRLNYDEVDTLYSSLASTFIIFDEHREKLRPLMKKMEDFLKDNK